jgi:DNA (cytosine-5)-methyltransferase 1
VTLTYGELFAGVGGFSIGFDQAGWTPKFQVEWDQHCQQVLAHHWPDVPRFGDVCDVNGAELPPVDVLSFGSPCQDLSVAGKRAGLEGGRSGMFYEATRIIKEMRNATGNQYPRVAVWENVPGAFTSNAGRDFGAVLDEMVDCGALVCEWAVLDAQNFGVPQRRRRIFLVAIFDTRIAAQCPDPLLPVREGSPRDFAKSRKAGQTTSALTGNGVGTCGADDNQAQGNHLVPETVGTIGPTFGAKNYSNIQEVMQGSLVPEVFVKAKRAQSPTDDDRWEQTDTAPTINQFDVGETRATVLIPEMLIDATRVNDVRVYDEPVQTLKERMGTGGNNVPMLAQPVGFSHTQGLDAQPSTEAFPSLRREGSGHAVATDMVVRRLTPLECERLMGWPDNHTLHRADGKTTSDTNRYKMCGNGVASPVAAWVAHHINQAEQGINQ